MLELYGRYDITTTWFTPGHTIDTFPQVCEQIAAKGHEFGHHGYFHENPPRSSMPGPRKNSSSGHSRPSGSVWAFGPPGTALLTGIIRIAPWTSWRNPGSSTTPLLWVVTSRHTGHVAGPSIGSTATRLERQAMSSSSR
ncbi:polysaccharide deacetylase family protein [Rothia santali]|uniref:polysaccharide deacetylase family protein n=1 Tax=Rothia santali TaxID=2949643 RepID=UPI0035A1BB3D